MIRSSKLGRRFANAVDSDLFISTRETNGDAISRGLAHVLKCGARLFLFSSMTAPRGPEAANQSTCCATPQ